MKNLVRKWLEKEVEQTVLPEFLRRGFQVQPLNLQERPIKEERTALPLGRLRRFKPDGSYEIVELQFGSYDEPELRVNFGVVPKCGITIRGKHFKQDEVFIDWLSSSWELYEDPKQLRWFKVRKWPWQKVQREDLQELTRLIVSLLPEIDRVLAGETPGKHIKVLLNKLD